MAHWTDDLDPAERVNVRRVLADNRHRKRWRTRLIVTAVLVGNAAVLALGLWR